MKRRLIMTLAMSLDGFIADENGGYDWIKGDGNKLLDTKNKWDFNAFLEGVDTVVMGKACYDQNMHNDFRDKAVLVATSSPPSDHDHVSFISGDICECIHQELNKPGKDIFLFGGGKVAHPFLEANMVDEYIIGIVPLLLGSGRPLFTGNTPSIPLKLTEYIIDEGTVILRYERR